MCQFFNLAKFIFVVDFVLKNKMKGVRLVAGCTIFGFGVAWGAEEIHQKTEFVSNETELLENILVFYGERYDTFTVQNCDNKIQIIKEHIELRQEWLKYSWWKKIWYNTPPSPYETNILIHKNETTRTKGGFNNIFSAKN